MEQKVYSTAVVLLAGAVSALAQSGLTAGTVAASLEQATTTTNLNRISISYRANFGASVRFKNLGGFTPAPLHSRIPGAISPGPASGFQENRVYEDGYNLVDDNLNSYGDLHATRNWGYLSGNQVIDSDGSQFVAMHVTSSAADAVTRELDDDPQHGFEINYSRQLQDHGTWKWGVGTAFNFMSLGVNHGRTLSGGVNQLTDWFAVPEGGFVPDAPYFGSNSEGPLLGSDPVAPPGGREQFYANAASITGRRQFDADIFGFKFGPYAEFPITEKLSFNLSAGLSLICISSDLSFSTETVTIDPALDATGLLTQTRPGSSTSKTDLVLGGYVNASLAWALNENWSAFGGLEFQGAGDYTHRDSSGRAAVLDLGQNVSCFLGISYSF